MTDSRVSVTAKTASGNNDPFIISCIQKILELVSQATSLRLKKAKESKPGAVRSQELGPGRNGHVPSPRQKVNDHTPKHRPKCETNKI